MDLIIKLGYSASSFMFGAVQRICRVCTIGESSLQASDSRGFGHWIASCTDKYFTQRGNDNDKVVC